MEHHVIFRYTVGEIFMKEKQYSFTLLEHRILLEGSAVLSS
jgi:hypothetical protein